MVPVECNPLSWSKEHVRLDVRLWPWVLLGLLL